MNWHSVNGPRGYQVRALVTPITAAQDNAFNAAYAAGGAYPTALSAFESWFHAMQQTIPQLAAALTAAELANLYNLINCSVAFNGGSPWRDQTYRLTALNGYLTSPGTLSNTEPLWVYYYTGNALVRSRSLNWGCGDPNVIRTYCQGLGFDLQTCETVVCCYILQYGRFPESIPALDSWGDLTGLHHPNGSWTFQGQGVCPSVPVPACDVNHPCLGGYSCVVSGQACIIDNANPPGCNGIGTACSGDAQCCAGLNCQGGNCQVPSPTCSSQAECSLGYVCVNGTCVPVGPGNCLPPTTVCSNTVQCCAGLVCNVVGQGGPGTCTDPSSLCGDVVCPAGQHCSNNQCVPNTVDPCAGVSCPGGYHCDNGNCIPDNPGCSSVTCLPPNSCQNGVCTAPGQGCDSSNCTAPNYCANGVCTAPPVCDATICPPPSSCQGGVCVPPGGNSSLVIVLGIVAAIGVGLAIAASEPQGSYY